jgi:hypothetical protein
LLCHFLIFPDDVGRLESLFALELVAIDLKLFEVYHLLESDFLLERAVKCIGPDELFKVDILCLRQFDFNLLCLFELGGLEEVSSLLEKCMHL